VRYGLAIDRPNGIPLYSQLMLRRVRTRRARVALVITLIGLLAGVVLNLLLSATPALSVSLLLAAAAVITLVLLLTRGRA
jgi:cobalamin synthase